MLASYTLAKAIDTAPDATSVVTGNAGDDTKVAQDTLQPNRERGSSVNDIRNCFVFSAAWDLNYAGSVSNTAAKALLGNCRSITQRIVERVKGGRASLAWMLARLIRFDVIECFLTLSHQLTSDYRIVWMSILAMLLPLLGQTDNCQVRVECAPDS